MKNKTKRLIDKCKCECLCSYNTNFHNEFSENKGKMNSFPSIWKNLRRKQQIFLFTKTHLKNGWVLKPIRNRHALTDLILEQFFLFNHSLYVREKLRRKLKKEKKNIGLNNKTLTSVLFLPSSKYVANTSS